MKLRLIVLSIVLAILGSMTLAAAQSAPYVERRYFKDNETARRGDSQTIVGQATAIESVFVPHGVTAISIGVMYTDDTDDGMDSTLQVWVKDITDSTETSPINQTTGDSLRIPIKINDDTNHSGSQPVNRTSLGEWFELSAYNPNVAADSALTVKFYMTIMIWR